MSSANIGPLINIAPVFSSRLKNLKVIIDIAIIRYTYQLSNTGELGVFKYFFPIIIDPNGDEVTVECYYKGN